MTTNTKVKAWRIATITFLTALAVTGLFKFNSFAANLTPDVANEGVTEETNLVCKVSTTGMGSKLVTITNQSDRIIAKGTKVSFEKETGIQTVKRLRSNLKPGKTHVIHLGRFDGTDCSCRVNQN